MSDVPCVPVRTAAHLPAPAADRWNHPQQNTGNEENLGPAVIKKCSDEP